MSDRVPANERTGGFDDLRGNACPLCDDGVFVEGYCDVCGESERDAHEIASERHGFGSCRTGRCIEPCGQHGGCRR